MSDHANLLFAFLAVLLFLKFPSLPPVVSGQAIEQHSATKPALVFVSSRRQTRLTALDLISFLAGSDNPKKWLRMDEGEMEGLAAGVKDQGPNSIEKWIHIPL